MKLLEAGSTVAELLKRDVTDHRWVSSAHSFELTEVTAVCVCCQNVKMAPKKTKIWNKN
jgi:hypothetical protein